MAARRRTRAWLRLTAGISAASLASLALAVGTTPPAGPGADTPRTAPAALAALLPAAPAAGPVPAPAYPDAPAYAVPALAAAPADPGVTPATGGAAPQMPGSTGLALPGDAADVATIAAVDAGDVRDARGDVQRTIKHAGRSTVTGPTAVARAMRRADQARSTLATARRLETGHRKELEKAKARAVRAARTAAVNAAFDATIPTPITADDGWAHTRTGQVPVTLAATDGWARTRTTAADPATPGSAAGTLAAVHAGTNTPVALLAAHLTPVNQPGQTAWQIDYSVVTGTSRDINAALRRNPDWVVSTIAAPAARTPASAVTDGWIVARLADRAAQARAAAQSGVQWTGTLGDGVVISAAQADSTLPTSDADGAGTPGAAADPSDTAAPGTDADRRGTRPAQPATPRPTTAPTDAPVLAAGAITVDDSPLTDPVTVPTLPVGPPAALPTTPAMPTSTDEGAAGIGALSDADPYTADPYTADPYVAAPAGPGTTAVTTGPFDPGTLGSLPGMAGSMAWRLWNLIGMGSLPAAPWAQSPTDAAASPGFVPDPSTGTPGYGYPAPSSGTVTGPSWTTGLVLDLPTLAAASASPDAIDAAARASDLDRAIAARAAAQVADAAAQDQLNAALLAGVAATTARTAAEAAREDLARATAELARLGVPAQVARIPVDSLGCPTAAPDGTLRGAAAGMDIARICRSAVRNAATPAAAKAVRWALRMLGAPYACKGVGRLEVYRFDCSSYVARAYWEGAGIPIAGPDYSPTTRNMVPWDGYSLASWAKPIRPDQLRPGDLVLYDTCPAGEVCAYRHVVMYLGNNLMAHTNACGDTSKIETFRGTSGSSFLGARRIVTR